MIKSKILFSDDICEITEILKKVKIDVFVTTNEQTCKYFLPLMVDSKTTVLLINSSIFTNGSLEWIYLFKDYEFSNNRFNSFQLDDFTKFIENRKIEFDVMVDNNFDFLAFFDLLGMNFIGINTHDSIIKPSLDSQPNLLQMEKENINLKKTIMKTEKKLEKRIAQVNRYKNRKIIRIIDGTKRRMLKFFKEDDKK